MQYICGALHLCYRSTRNVSRTTVVHQAPVAIKLRSLAVLFKLRLASLVVMSAAFGYLFGIPQGAFSWTGIIGLCIAGTLLTGLVADLYGFGPAFLLTGVVTLAAMLPWLRARETLGR